MKAIRVLAAALWFALGLVTVSCAPFRVPSSETIPDAQTVAFSSTLAALEVLDELHAQRMRAIETPTQEQVVWATRHTEQLRRMRGALVIWRRWLTGDASQDQGMAAARDAVAAMRLIVDEMKAQRVPVPSAVSTALATMQGFM